MSRDCALKNLNLQPTDRWAHTEYSLTYHKKYLEEKAGLPEDHPDFSRNWKAALQIDFNWMVEDGLIDWREAGRVTDMGHAVYAEDGSDERANITSPFTTLEEIWAFNAVDEYGLPDDGLGTGEFRSRRGTLEASPTWTPELNESVK